MRVDITGRHVDITPGLRQLIGRRLGKLERLLNDRALSADFTLTKEKYRCRTDLVSLERVANKVRPFPGEFIAPSGHDVTQAYLDYIRPLIGGELPPYARLRNVAVPKTTSVPGA